MSKHTPGPWVLKSWHEAEIVTREGSDPIASVYSDKNRKLIAAAPDLLAAAEDALQSLQRLPDTEGAWRVTCIAQLRTAIARARGEE